MSIHFFQNNKNSLKVFCSVYSINKSNTLKSCAKKAALYSSYYFHNSSIRIFVKALRYQIKRFSLWKKSSPSSSKSVKFFQTQHSSLCVLAYFVLRQNVSSCFHISKPELTGIFCHRPVLCYAR